MNVIAKVAGVSYVAKVKKTGLPTKGKSIGSSMGGTMETTKGYQKRLRAKRKAEEEYWKSMNGPVSIVRPPSSRE